MQKSLVNSIISSITKKYILIYCLVLVIPILLFYRMIVGYTHHILETNIITNNAVSVDALGKRLNAELANVVVLLQLVGNDAKEHASTALMYADSREMLARSPLIHAMYFLDEQSRIQFEVPFMQGAPGQAYAYPNFNEAKWTLNYTVSDMIRNPYGEPAITIAVPVLREGNKFSGMLVVELSREYLAEIVKAHSAPANAFGYIVDRQGTVIASTDPEEWGKNYAHLQSVHHLLGDTYGSEREAFQGEPSSVSYELIKEGWGVMIGVPERIAFAPVDRLSLILTLSFGGILLFSFVLIFLGIRHLLAPVVRLTQLAQNFTAETSLREISRLKRYRSADELGLLMRTFIRVGVSNLEKQQLLAEKERYLRNVIEGIPYAIVTLDNNGLVTYFNRQFEQLAGGGAQQLLGMRWEELPMNRRPDERIVIDLAGIDPLHEVESHVTDAKGEKHAIKVIVTRFFHEQGGVAGILVVMDDVSQQKLLEAYARQQEKLASIGQITTGIAHEIKNPLAILSGAAELLKEEVQEKQHVDEIIRELVDDIAQVVVRMNGITNDFLHFAKRKQDQSELVNLDSLIEKVLHLLRIKLSECRIHVSKQTVPDFPDMMGKSDKLMQVFLNIILNSIDSMPGGGTLTIQLTVHCGEHTEWLSVAIRDTGTGIAANQLDWLFNPFYSTKTNGSGLGLTIARDIVNEHAGQMEIQSKLDEGTIVRCTFPKITHGGPTHVSYANSHDRR